MKNKYLRTTIVMFIGFTIISKIGAQDSGNTEMKPFEIERESIKKSVTSLRTAFSKMFSTAKFVDKKGTGSCKPEDLVGKISIDGLISDNKNLIEEFSSIKDAYLGYPSHLRDAPSVGERICAKAGSEPRHPVGVGPRPIHNVCSPGAERLPLPPHPDRRDLGGTCRPE